MAGTIGGPSIVREYCEGRREGSDRLGSSIRARSPCSIWSILRVPTGGTPVSSGTLKEYSDAAVDAEATVDTVMRNELLADVFSELA